MARPIALALVVTAASLSAQESAFDVASIKPYAGPMPFGASTIGVRNGEFTAANVPVRRLVAYAYGIPLSRVVGGPGWIDSERWEIIARPPAESRATLNSLMDQRLRGLLADRFKLVVRHEVRQATVYTISRGRSDRTGPQLKVAQAPCTGAPAPFVPPAPGQSFFDLPAPCGMSNVSDGKSVLIRGRAVTIGDLASALTRRLEVPVSNATNLMDKYDFDLRYAEATPSVDAPAEWPVLSDAFRDQLGLRLASSKAPIDFIVIDHVERPTEN